jgi:uncharacterized protein (DUF2267 family)
VGAVQARDERHGRDAELTPAARFLHDIAETGVLPAGVEPADAAVAVICTLTARLGADHTRDAYALAALPGSLRELLRSCDRHAGEPPAVFGRGEFLRRIAAHVDVEQALAEPIALAVFGALHRLLPMHEVEDAAAVLPPELAQLWRAALSGTAARVSGVPLPLTLPAGRFVLDEIERSGALPEGLDPAHAFTGVLCTLAGLLSADCGARVAAALPQTLRPLFERCPQHRETREASFDPSEFVLHLAEHLGTDDAQAEEIARAVFAALRRLISPEDVAAVEACLPDDLQDLWD